MSIKTIYVISPPNYATGGTLLLHQAAYYFNQLGITAKMFYGKKIKSDPVHEQFKKFGIDYDTKIPNQKDVMVIVPEVRIDHLRNYRKVHKVIWWLSVDNFHIEIDSLKPKRRIYRNLMGYYNVFNDHYTHLVQSKYAETFLKEKNVKSRFLSDYLDDVYTSMEVDFSKPRTSQILYNPKKGIETTKLLMEKFPNYNWVPLENLSPEQMRNLMLESKVYIDFGNHPGKDRIPREAAICGCCVITNKNGSAAFQEDVPIDPQYKFDEETLDFNRFEAVVHSIFEDYSSKQSNFSNYREKIKNEQSVFVEEMKSFIDSIK
ncbi:hypothetical protein [Persicobacter psychrovividus]|uniref:Glycosyltransferase family 1 protein n=1 Tax=Persicobacter psychrovividus TaxID=387638 RepID=A0ABM7VAX1_9BACT|nr:hypothetical protein PEPS_03470 [Persicobacter psychrovividus]